MSIIPLGITRCGKSEFRWGERTYLMGIINVTPDSFSGDGLGYDVEAAVRLAREMVEEGADVIDVGGESTRPGSAANPFLALGKRLESQPLPIDEELRRVLPVIRRLAQELEVPISVDTYKAEVARQAVAEGAAMINDIWGLKFDPSLARVAAQAGIPVILMHNQESPYYLDLLAEVLVSLRQSIAVATEAGVPEEN